MSHAFSKVWFLAILIAILSGGIFAWQYFGVPQKAAESGKNKMTEEKIDTSNWQTYRNEEIGFELKYPDSWTLTSSSPAVHPKTKEWIGAATIIIANGSVSENPTLAILVDHLGFGPPDQNAIYELEVSEENGITITDRTEFIEDRVGAPLAKREFVYIDGSIKHNNHDYFFQFSFNKEEVDYERVFEDILSTFRFVESLPEETQTEQTPKQQITSISVGDILRGSQERHRLWDKFAAVYTGTITAVFEDGTSRKKEGIFLREKEDEKLVQTEYDGALYYGEGINTKISGFIDGTKYHFLDKGAAVVACYGKSQTCQLFGSSPVGFGWFEKILSLMGNEASNILTLQHTPYLYISYPPAGEREILHTYAAAILHATNTEELIEEMKNTARIETPSICDRVNIWFDMEEISDFADENMERPYGNLDPQDSFARGEICFDRKTGLGSRLEIEFRLSFLDGEITAGKIQEELVVFVSYTGGLRDLEFPESVLQAF